MAGQSGTNFTGTPDGREGWAQFFIRQGYAIYMVELKPAAIGHVYVLGSVTYW